jgi:hypothetical protein
VVSRRDRFETARVVSLDSDDRQGRVVYEELLGACDEGRAGDVDRKEDDLVLFREEGLDQQSRLFRASTSEFHERRVVRKHSDYRFRMLLQDAAFRPCHIVLGDFADLLEEFRADFVVKKSGGQ